MVESGGAKPKKSVKDRVARAEKTFQQKSSRKGVVIGVVLVLVAGGVLGWLFMPEGGTGPEEGQGRGQPVEIKIEGDFGKAWKLTNDAKELARGGDVEGAIGQLEAALGGWDGKWDCECYLTMSACLDFADPVPWERKLEYLHKAQELRAAGGEWIYDPKEVKDANLEESIRAAREKANR
jgi:hypothetical protein